MADDLESTARQYVHYVNDGAESHERERGLDEESFIAGAAWQADRTLPIDRDALAEEIEQSIENRTHMARRLYPDVYKHEVADDVIAFLKGRSLGL